MKALLRCDWMLLPLCNKTVQFRWGVFAVFRFEPSLQAMEGFVF